MRKLHERKPIHIIEGALAQEPSTSDKDQADVLAEETFTLSERASSSGIWCVATYPFNT
jgi:hypothetical protein